MNTLIIALILAAGGMLSFPGAADARSYGRSARTWHEHTHSACHADWQAVETRSFDIGSQEQINSRHSRYEADAESSDWRFGDDRDFERFISN